MNDTAVWWFWIQSTLLNTDCSITDATGGWIGEFDRHGLYGDRARARTLRDPRLDLRLQRRRNIAVARRRRTELVRIEEDRMHVDGRWLHLDMPRDARFTSTVSGSGDVLLRIRPTAGEPWARIEIDTRLPEAEMIAVMLLFVLTCDYNLAHTSAGGSD